MMGRRAAMAAALAAATLAGCTGQPTLSPTPSPTPRVSGSGVSSTSATPGASGSPSAAPSSPVPTEVAPVPTAPPPAPTAPAPSTAGGLDEGAVARPTGWSPTAKPGSSEEGFLGNGTWVHATSPEHSAFSAISLGCTKLGPYPLPVAALEGNLTDGSGRPGVGLTLGFSDAAAAQAYFTEWVRQAEACLGTQTTLVDRTEDTWLGRRTLDTVWSEAVGVRADRVSLLIVDSPDANLAGAIPGA